MVLIIALLAWGQPEYVQVRWTVMGEVLECVLEPAGSHRARGSTRIAVWVMVGSLVAGSLGTALPGPTVDHVAQPAHPCRVLRLRRMQSRVLRPRCSRPRGRCQVASASSAFGGAALFSLRSSATCSTNRK
jgi:hypothetical protein